MGHVGPTLVDALTERKEQPAIIFPLSQQVVLKSLPNNYYSLFIFHSLETVENSLQVL
jgi:hypothetical protein